MNSRYGGAIWTNHALERLQQRRLSQQLAFQAFQYPEETVTGKQNNTLEFRRREGASLITIIAKQNDKREWIILSCWVDPPLPGSIDIPRQEAYWRYRTDAKNATFWGKFWVEIKRQFGFYR